MKKTNKVPEVKASRSIYVDSVTWDQCRSKGVNINAEINKLLKKIANTGTCPECGQKLETK